MVGKIDEIVDKTVEKADSVKVHAADSLSDASQKMRAADINARGEEFKHFVNDLDARRAQIGSEIGHRAEPVETFIKEHPFTSVLIAAGVAAGVGVLIGSLISRRD